MASIFTSEEIEIIDNIKEGTKELIENILSNRIKSPKEYANQKALTKIRPSTHTVLIHEIINIFRKDKNYIFRRSDLMKRLPDSLRVIEDYDSELTRILKSLARSNLIVPSSRLPRKGGPGHPKKDEGKYYAISGPKSYYQASPFLIKILDVLDNPNAIKIIHTHLLESGALLELYKRGHLISSHWLKENNLDTAKMNRQIINLKRNRTELEFEKQFQNDSKRIKFMNKKEIEEEAKKWAKVKLNAFTPDDFMWLYPLGATYYIKDIIRYIPLSKND
ncbi:MAG TPA: hypothetical protein VFP49_11200 [Nitrososphaeraceae archaeon]|nr:hypothetical protein [Nitrososphaeraceae archaeon]